MFSVDKLLLLLGNDSGFYIIVHFFFYPPTLGDFSIFLASGTGAIPVGIYKGLN